VTAAEGGAEAGERVIGASSRGVWEG
jgi:hypothetical protein